MDSVGGSLGTTPQLSLKAWHWIILVLSQGHYVQHRMLASYHEGPLESGWDENQTRILGGSGRSVNSLDAMFQEYFIERGQCGIIGN